MVYGWFEAWDIRLERVTIATAKLPPSVSRLRIVQISDVHLGLIVGDTRLRKIAALICQAEPDLIVSTGDLVDGHLDGYAELVGHFNGIHPALGKYAVTGNHEFYAGLDHSLAFLRLAGFEVLRGEARSVQGLLTLVGVDDPVGEFSSGAGIPLEKELLADAGSSRLIVLLKHRPVVDREAGHFDLQLSGHIHQGQIFPFGLLTKLFYPAPAGLSQLHDNSFLYVSRGTGTWGPPIRFLSPPEVTLFELVPIEGER
jgi:predicted MPP superfamily phosphohydrolase